jgi:transcriptional regulator with XRE-family HTH domain
VFELGNSLRDARERRGLSYADVERDTRIRPRYLRALEEETFDALPGQTYAKGFLREYADFLGLDGQQFVDEFSSRFPPPDEGPKAPLQPIARPGIRLPSTTSLAVGGIALAILAVSIWLVGVGGGSKQSQQPPPRHHTPPPPPPPPPAPAKPRLVSLTLTATRGSCWLDAHRGSQTGTTLHTGTLQPGQSVHLAGRRIWIRLGDPPSLNATLNGKAVALPQLTPVNVLVTPAGVRQTG